VKGRPHKARLNEVVTFRGDWGVVVAYRDKPLWRRYLVVRTDSLGRAPYGPAIPLSSVELTPTGRTAKTAGINYRKNLGLGGEKTRECNCQCCPHIRGFAREPEE
jgi:hypothetical protein